MKLEAELRKRTYKPGQSICFVVTKPKAREIFAADFRDRIIHHLLVGYLEPLWEKIFIFPSFACRKGKGSHLAVQYLKKAMRQTSRNFTRPAYYLQVDISAFFMSLDKHLLFAAIAKRCHNPEILWLAQKIIFHDPTDNFYQKGDVNLFRIIPNSKSLFKVPAHQGLPIGNLTSQFFANIYLNSLDHFVKHRLKVKHYLRYVDDFLLIHENPEQLSVWKKEISHFLEEQLKLKLHPRKSVQQSVYKGVNFVGFIVKPGHSLVRRRTVNNLKVKLREFNRSTLPISSEMFETRLQTILAVINSYYGQFQQSNTFHLRKSVYLKHFGILKTYFQPADSDFCYFQMKETKKRNLAKPALIAE